MVGFVLLFLHKSYAGVMVWHDTQQRFEGEWNNDVPDGQGVYIWLNIAGLGAGVTAPASASVQDELSLTHLQDCNRYVGAP